MAILFMGGEEIDFDRFYGTTGVSLGANQFRSDFARCAIQCAGGGENLSSSAMASFSASANFWFTGRPCFSSLSYLNAAGDFRQFLAFADSGKKRLSFGLDGNRFIRLSSYNDAGAETVLATSTEAVFASAGISRIDVQIIYGSSGGRVRFLVNQVVFLDYTGNTSNVSTTLNQFMVSAISYLDTSSTAWSEMIVADQDTRTLSLKTHVPVATAPGHAWLGSQTDINETVLDESNMITTDTLDTAAKFTVSQLNAGNYAIRGFKVSAWAARGSTGPAHLNLGVRTNGTDNYGPDLNLDTGWGKFSQTYNVNPVTNTAWTQNDINAVQIAAKSKS